jgi:hypothetical protein
MASPPSPKPQSTMHKTTLAILAAYGHQSIEEIMSFRTPDCIHKVLPCNSYPFISPIPFSHPLISAVIFPDQHGNPLTATASLPRTQMSNTGYRTFFAATIPKIWNFRIKISDIIESPQSSKVVVLASSTADSKSGIGTYGQEYVLIFEFDESGEKITKMVEWVDSIRAKEQATLLFG